MQEVYRNDRGVRSFESGGRSVRSARSGSLASTTQATSADGEGGRVRRVRGPRSSRLLLRRPRDLAGFHSGRSRLGSRGVNEVP